MVAASVFRKGVFIVGAKRTPFGSFGGSLARQSATALAVHASKAAIAEAGLDPKLIDSTFMGNVIQSSPDACYLARHVHLKSGGPVDKPALTLNRLCGSGFETAVQGALAISSGSADITLCGGSENMSASPLTVAGAEARFGVALGKGLKLEDSLWAGLTDSHAGMPMGVTAETLGAKYSVSRGECDEYAARSQMLWAAGHATGAFKDEIAPMEVKSRKGPVIMDSDESPRKDVTSEGLAKLKPVFKPDGGLVTAGNASGISDGAGSLLLCSEKAMGQHGLQPLARVVASHTVGCEPSIMGIGPAEAIRGALQAAGLQLADMDVVEVNEAFAAQFLAVERELGLNRDICNMYGGAIALGHPLGASGSRILAHLTHTLRRTGLRYGVGAACIGGGQGIAVILENPTFAGAQ